MRWHAVLRQIAVPALQSGKKVYGDEFLTMAVLWSMDGGGVVVEMGEGADAGV